MGDIFKNTKHALDVRKEVQRRRKSRRMYLKEQITKEKQSQDILRGINNVCGALFQSTDVKDVTFFIRDDSLNNVLMLLSMESLLYDYRVEGNMLQIFARVAQ
jgi:hypothetical protein